MSRQQSPEWNPYVSPGPDTSEADAGARQAAPPFGLERPIHAAGAIGPEHIAEATSLGLGPFRIRSWLTVVGVPALGTAYLCLTLGPANTLSLAVATFTTLMFSFVLAHGLSHWTTRRQLARRYQGGGRSFELMFTDDDIAIRSETCESVGTWEGYTKCAVAPSLVVLQAMDYATSTLVPRSFFANQDEWDVFSQLVRHKLPEDKPLPPVFPTVPPEAATMDGRREPLVRGRGVLTFGHMRRAAKYFPKYRRARASAVLWPLGISAAALLPTGLLAASGGLTSAAQLLPGFAALAWIVWLFFIEPRRRAVFPAKAADEPVVAFAVAFAEEEVVTQSECGRTRYRWEHFGTFRRAGDTLLLFYRRENTALPLPKSFFTEPDWERLLAIVAQKLPARGSVATYAGAPLGSPC